MRQHGWQPSLRILLLLLVCVALLPVLGVAGYAVHQLWTTQYASAEQDGRRLAQASALLLDRELHRIQTALEVLATSPLLQTGDIEGFYRQAQTLHQLHVTNVVLSDLSGQQLMNTQRPFGTPLPFSNVMDVHQTVIATGKPQMSDLVIGAVLKKPLVTVEVPVFKDVRIAMVLYVSIDSPSMAALMADMALPEGWVTAVTDRQGVLITRGTSPELERRGWLGEPYVGKTVRGDLLTAIQERSDGTVVNVSREGITMFNAFARSKVSGWTVIIGVPKDRIDGPVWHYVSVVLALAATLATASIMAAIVLSRYISQRVRRLADVATALGRGTEHRPPLSGIREVDQVANALAEAATRRRVAESHMVAAMDEALLARAEAERADRAKSKFLAAASHDLRQPVQSLVLFIGVLKARTADAALAGVVRSLEQAVEALQSMLNGILDLSKLDAGVLVPRMTDFPISDLFRQLESEYEVQARQKGIDLRVVPCGAWVRSDPAWLQRIVRNLVENALRYTESGRILVGARRRGGNLTIAVIDTGIGISAEHQSQIFDEFFQVGNEERDRSRGLGLGLAIVKRLVTLVGHRLELASQPGRGSRFSIDVPIAKPAPREMPRETLTELPSHRSVLVIDDDALVRESLALMLTGWGYGVRAAADTEQALAAVRELGGRIDAVIADYRLAKGVTGISVIDALRVQCGRPVPAIIITGDTAPERIQDVHRSRHNILHKPVSASQLQAAVWRLVMQTEPVADEAL